MVIEWCWSMVLFSCWMIRMIAWSKHCVQLIIIDPSYSSCHTRTMNDWWANVTCLIFLMRDGRFVSCWFALTITMFDDAVYICDRIFDMTWVLQTCESIFANDVILGSRISLQCIVDGSSMRYFIKSTTNQHISTSNSTLLSIDTGEGNILQSAIHHTSVWTHTTGFLLDRQLLVRLPFDTCSTFDSILERNKSIEETQVSCVHTHYHWFCYSTLKMLEHVDKLLHE